MSDMSGVAEGFEDDLPRWPFRLAVLLGLELWGISFAIIHPGSGHSVSYDLAAAMAPSMLVAIPLGFVARRWARAWWTPARLGTVLALASFGGLVATNYAELREQWSEPKEPHHFVSVPEKVGPWSQLTDAATVLTVDERVEPLRTIDDPPAAVSSRVFATAGEKHVAQLILITPDRRGDLRRQLRESRATVVSDLLGGAGARRPQFLTAGSNLGGRFGCGHGVSRGVGEMVTCAWAVHDVAGIVVFFADDKPDLAWAGKQARAFRDAVERSGAAD